MCVYVVMVEKSCDPGKAEEHSVVDGLKTVYGERRLISSDLKLANYTLYAHHPILCLSLRSISAVAWPPLLLLFFIHSIFKPCFSRYRKFLRLFWDIRKCRWGSSFLRLHFFTRMYIPLVSLVSYLSLATLRKHCYLIQLIFLLF